MTNPSMRKKIRKIMGVKLVEYKCLCGYWIIKSSWERHLETCFDDISKRNCVKEIEQIKEWTNKNMFIDIIYVKKLLAYLNTRLNDLSED